MVSPDAVITDIREMPMYVTYSELIQFGLFLVALVGLVFKISHEDKK